MMLTRDDIEGLPDDPNDAFAMIAEKFLRFVADKERDRAGMSNTDADGNAA